MSKSKRHRHTRFITQINNGQVDHLVLQESKYAKALAFPNQPDSYSIYTQGAHSDFIGRITADGFIFWCKGCRREHTLLLNDSDYNRAQELAHRHEIPFYNILCIDGERLQIALPGERYEGSRVTCIHRVIAHITSDGENDG